MAIKVKHEGNVTSRVMASAGGGKGRRQAEDAVRLTQIQSQENMAAQERASRESMQASSTAASLASSGLGRAPGIMGAPSGPSGLASHGGLASPSKKYDDRPVRETFTERQQEEFNRMSEALVKAEQSGDYTPEEMTELRKQVRYKQMGIEPVQIMKRQVYPEGQDSGQTWKLDDGTVVTRNNKGDVVKLVDSQKPENNSGGISPDKAFQMAYNMASDEVAESGGKVNLDRVKAIMSDINSVVSGNQQEQTGSAGIPFSFMDNMFGFTDFYDDAEKPDFSTADVKDPAKKWRVQ